MRSNKVVENTTNKKPPNLSVRGLKGEQHTAQAVYRLNYIT